MKLTLNQFYSAFLIESLKKFSASGGKNISTAIGIRPKLENPFAHMKTHRRFRNSMARAREAVMQIQAAYDQIEANVTGIPASWLVWRPSPEAWSILDILCHIEEFIPYWTGQILTSVSYPDREWGRTHNDHARLAAVENTSERNPATILASIHSQIDDMSQRLSALDDAALDITAPSRNPSWGVKPVSFIFEDLLVMHLCKHSGQIQRNISQLRNLNQQQES